VSAGVATLDDRCVPVHGRPGCDIAERECGDVGGEGRQPEPPRSALLRGLRGQPAGDPSQFVERAGLTAQHQDHSGAECAPGCGEPGPRERQVELWRQPPAVVAADDVS
jgi:hypothetical protein